MEIKKGSPLNNMEITKGSLKITWKSLKRALNNMEIKKGRL